MTRTIIEVTGARFRYNSTTAIGPFDVKFRTGAITFIVGPNGAGKTTLLRMIAGLAVPTEGTVRVFGMNPTLQKRRELAKRLAFLPQQCELAFPFTVAEIVLLGRYAHGRRGLAGFMTAKTDRQSANLAMERCDVAELANRPWNQLSGGEQRRTLLAQAFCQEADILLLDEPTASLDPAHAIAVFETIRAYNQHSRTQNPPTHDAHENDSAPKKTVLVVSHDLNLAARFADQIVLIGDGLVKAHGNATDVLTSAATQNAFGVHLHLGTLPNSDQQFVVPA